MPENIPLFIEDSYGRDETSCLRVATLILTIRYVDSAGQPCESRLLFSLNNHLSLFIMNSTA